MTGHGGQRTRPANTPATWRADHHEATAQVVPDADGGHASTAITVMPGRADQPRIHVPVDTG